MLMSNCIYIMLVWTHLTRREGVELMLYYLIYNIDIVFLLYISLLYIIGVLFK